MCFSVSAEKAIGQAREGDMGERGGQTEGEKEGERQEALVNMLFVSTPISILLKQGGVVSK